MASRRKRNMILLHWRTSLLFLDRVRALHRECQTEGLALQFDTVIVVVLSVPVLLLGTSALTLALAPVPALTPAPAFGRTAALPRCRAGAGRADRDGARNVGNEFRGRHAHQAPEGLRGHCEIWFGHEHTALTRHFHSGIHLGLHSRGPTAQFPHIEGEHRRPLLQSSREGAA